MKEAWGATDWRPRAGSVQAKVPSHLLGVGAGIPANSFQIELEAAQRCTRCGQQERQNVQMPRHAAWPRSDAPLVAQPGAAARSAGNAPPAAKPSLAVAQCFRALAAGCCFSGVVQQGFQEHLATAPLEIKSLGCLLPPCPPEMDAVSLLSAASTLACIWESRSGGTLVTRASVAYTVGPGNAWGWKAPRIEVGWTGGWKVRTTACAEGRAGWRFTQQAKVVSGPVKQGGALWWQQEVQAGPPCRHRSTRSSRAHDNKVGACSPAVAGARPPGWPA